VATLRIDGLDSTPLLGRLRLTGRIERLLITDDRHLTDLSSLTLPPGRHRRRWSARLIGLRGKGLHRGNR
jgi:hypothetical protein